MPQSDPHDRGVFQINNASLRRPGVDRYEVVIDHDLRRYVILDDQDSRQHRQPLASGMIRDVDDLSEVTSALQELMVQRSRFGVDVDDLADDDAIRQWSLTETGKRQLASWAKLRMDKS